MNSICVVLGNFGRSSPQRWSPLWPRECQSRRLQELLA